MEFSELTGKTLVKIETTDYERIIFVDDTDTAYASCHQQDCCESVSVQEVIGNLDDVLNSPILEASETFDTTEKPPEHPDSWTRTYQRLRTAKGEVTFHWLGESNGYYSETPYFGFTHA